MGKIKQCIICGREFEYNRKGHVKYCSEECKNDGKMYHKDKVKRREVLASIERSKKLEEDELKARQLGMSYGQYKAMKWMKQQEDDREKQKKKEALRLTIETIRDMLDEV